jgi:hypothetical protein
MGTVKLNAKDAEGEPEVRSFSDLSSKDEALTLAIQELTKAITLYNMRRTQRNG